MCTRTIILLMTLAGIVAANVRMSDPLYKENASCDYLIITPADQAIVKEFRRLEQWKWEKGLKTRLVTLDSITANFAGADVQHKIRNFLKKAYADWGVTWVLLGGDYRLIPARKVTSERLSPADSVSFLSDAYYSCLDGEMDAPDGYVYTGAKSETTYKLECRFDENGEFVCDRAVPEVQGIDLWSDVYIGRMPISNADEARVMIDKTLQYASTPRDEGFEGGAFFFGPKIHYRVLRDYASRRVEITDAADYWHHEVAPVLTGSKSALRRALVDELYEDSLAPDGSIVPDSQYLTTDAVHNRLSRGYNLVYFSCHGNPHHIWLSSSGPVTWYRVDNATDLQSRSYSNIISISCSVMKMPAESTLCFAKGFLTNPNGGAVTYSGSSNEDYFSSKRYQYLYATRDLANGTTTRISKAFQVANLRLDSYNKFVHQYWGDPELELWTASDGRQMAVNAFRAGNRMRVEVNPPLDSVLVCVYKQGVMFRRGYTRRGVVELDSINWAATDIRITASMHNYVAGGILTDGAAITTTGIARRSEARPTFAFNGAVQRRSISIDLSGGTDGPRQISLRDLRGRTITRLVIPSGDTRCRIGPVSPGSYVISHSHDQRDLARRVTVR